MRYLSASTLARAYGEMGGNADHATLDALRDVAQDADRHGLHAVAAALLVGLLRRRVVGDQSEEFALVVTELLYNRNGWTLIGRDRAVVEEVGRLGADPAVTTAQVADRLAVLARPLPTSD